MDDIDDKPYDIPRYVRLSSAYRSLGYPDLAVGAAYKALLLSDAVNDESDEYHDQAVDALVCREPRSADIDETATQEAASTAVESIAPIM